VICFDTFELDVQARELRRGPERVRLQAQPFELLAAMLERPGDVVTRAALAKRLWPDGTFVDFEHSLNAAVKRLRTALGDDADQPRFVETLPRRGYRFIAPCTWRGEAAPGARTRVAVLPFTDSGRTIQPQAFGDGLTEEVMAQLGAPENVALDVIARMSSSTFKNGTCLARDIGAALRAEYLLEGGVRHSGNRVRITVWLVDVATETPVWTGVYDRCSDDVLATQADVANRISRSVAAAIAESPLRHGTSLVTRVRAQPDRAHADLSPQSAILNGVFR
jgi:TolB-like protein